MTTDQRFEQLRELSWRRRLTEAEAAELRAWLTAHPEAQADWEAEAGLNGALRRLPDAPVPSNFTARVLQAIERENAAAAAASPWRWRWVWQPKWLVRAGLATVVLVLGIETLHIYEVRKQQEGLIRRVAAVSGGEPLPSLEVLTNFDTIFALNEAATDPRLALARPDQELLDLFR
jgi:hypothetical protein